MATGVTLIPSGVRTVSASPAGRGALVGSGGAVAVDLAPFGPDVIRAMTWPTVTVSPASASSSVIVPGPGAGTSASTLSVEISTIVSSASTWSPGCLAHSRIVPSETDSPIAGIVISTTCSSAGVVDGGSSASAGAASRCVGAISASTAPMPMVSPSAAWIFTTVPVSGAGTSASTLSVEISTRVSPSATSSPSCLCHSRMDPSETESPIGGMTTSTVVLTAITGS